MRYCCSSQESNGDGRFEIHDVLIKCLQSVVTETVYLKILDFVFFCINYSLF